MSVCHTCHKCQLAGYLLLIAKETPAQLPNDGRGKKKKEKEKRKTSMRGSKLSVSNQTPDDLKDASF